MAHQRPSDVDQLHEELTAYLDGELPPDAVRRVEERLARDADYHGELQRLERTWNLLDRLPRSTVDDSFTQTTIEMVAVAASEEAQDVEKTLPALKRRRRLFGLCGVLAAAATGFVIGKSMWPSPNEPLLRDLPVLENYDLYYQADDVEFLRSLDRAGLFADGDENGS